MGIFEDLKALGFENVESLPVYEKKELAKDLPQKRETVNEASSFDPDGYIAKRKYECPVCGMNFESWFIRSAKVRLIGSDSDLRPHYEPFDPLYYDVTFCPECGYAAMSSTFNTLTDNQVGLIRDAISEKYIKKIYPQMYTLADAIERYKMALFCSIVKKSRSSERAMLCLKLSWLERENHNSDAEREFAENALTGFLMAYQNESPPIAGLDEPTLIYLLGELSRRIGKLTDAMNFISKVLLNRGISPRLRERAEDVKELIREAKKEKGDA